MKRIAAWLLAAALVLPGAAAAAPQPAPLPFADVAVSDWFYGDVRCAWENGWILGRAADAFVPDGPITHAEAVKLAAVMRQSSLDGRVTIPARTGEDWYLPYVEYCRGEGILSASYDWNAAAPRAVCMEIFADALPDGALAAVNDIADGAIPDLDGLAPSAVEAIYRLYRAGVAQGTGPSHAPAARETVTRAEAAAMVTRLMFPERRIRFSMPAHTVEVIDGATYIDGILIVNKSYPLPPTFAPGGLTADCAAAFRALCAGAAAEGLFIYAVSGYRSYEFQAQLYANYAARDGQAAADRYSARAGHSEHQSGLAIDVNGTVYSFADTAEGQWIAAHCHEYGFILRYPADKEDVTGYLYEPWHIRYLGVEQARAVWESGLTLEEYLGITSEYAG